MSYRLVHTGQEVSIFRNWSETNLQQDDNWLVVCPAWWQLFWKINLIQCAWVKVIGPARTGLMNLVYGAGNFGNIFSACGQREIQYTLWNMNTYMYNNIHNFHWIFSIYRMQ
jgi:hypothetical protein